MLSILLYFAKFFLQNFAFFILLIGGIFMATTYGYARVSRHEQNEARQLRAFNEFGISSDYIFVDKCSGKNFNRPQYQKMIDNLKPNDLVVVQSIDRFGRNYYDNLNQVRIIKNEKKADFVVIDSPTIDTRKISDINGNFILDLSIMLASQQAETEYRYIHQRQAEGIANAKANGIKCGRPDKPKPGNFEEVYAKWNNQEISARSAAKLLDVSTPTFLKWTREEISSM